MQHARNLPYKSAAWSDPPAGRVSSRPESAMTFREPELPITVSTGERFMHSHSSSISELRPKNSHASSGSNTFRLRNGLCRLQYSFCVAFSAFSGPSSAAASYLRDRGDEFVTSPRYGLNEAVTVLVISKDPAQNIDVLLHILLIYKALRPQSLEEFLFLYQSVSVVY